MKKGSCIFKHDSIAFHLRKMGRESMFHLDLHFGNCLMKFAKLSGSNLSVFLRRCVFLESHGGFGFHHSLRCTFPRESGQTAYLEVVWQCHRSHLKGLASELARKRQSNVLMILLNGNVSMWLVVVRFSLTKILLSAPFECTPLGTSKRALEKCWFGRSRPSTDG